MKRRKGPPRWASSLLELVLPRDVRDEVMGDLSEEWSSRHGRPADAWYSWQALLLVLSFLPSRFSEIRAQRNSRVDALLRHLRFAFRMLARRPGWSSLAVLTLALGIGLTATAFSIVYGSVYRGLPIEDAHELVHFERMDLTRGRSLAVTPHDYVAWRDQQASFEDLGAYVEAALTLAGEDGAPERADGLYISANAFELLRTGAALGRVIIDDDDRPGAAAVMLVGHRVWQNRFGADPDIVGRVLRVNGEPVTLVGVMPESFAFPISEQYWLPLKLDLANETRGSGRLDVFGRLRPGVDLASARADLAAIGSRLESAHPETNAGIGPTLTPFTEEYLGEEFPRLVLTLLSAAVLVLLIACANVGSLLSAQASRRSGEIAIRRAMGASGAELFAQTLTETLVLSFTAFGLGIVGARLVLFWFDRAWISLGDLGLPHGPDGLFWWRFELDAVPLAFVLLCTFATATVTSLFPLLEARRAHVSVSGLLQRDARAASASSRERLRFGSMLVIAEVAMTTALLLAAGLTVQSVVNLTRVDYGFSVDDVLTARIGLPDDGYPDDASRRRFWDELTRRLSDTPGVEACSAATTLPMRVARMTVLAVRGEALAGRSERELPRVRTSTIDDGFFETFGVSLLEGRAFESTDRAGGQPVAIVNESFARRYFPGESALMREIRLGHDDSGEPFRTVVGVVPDLWMDGSRDRSAPGVYLPLSQSSSPYDVGLRYLSVAMRSPLSPEGSARALRAAVAEIDPELPVYAVVSMSELIADGTGRYRIYGTFYIAMGIVALVLASMGLYGVLSFHVAGSAADIGIRMALGSSPASIVRLYLSRGLRQVGVGAGLGVLLSAWLGAGLQRALFEVELWSAPAVAGVVLTLGVTAAVACYLPARRASLMAPMQATRR